MRKKLGAGAHDAISGHVPSLNEEVSLPARYAARATWT